ncbi:MAG: hypothetical protein GX446_06345 [Chthonomonadales bacterium]|nr:hypothetical protein [Chthonomonadales bacterium]
MSDRSRSGADRGAARRLRALGALIAGLTAFAPIGLRHAEEHPSIPVMARSSGAHGMEPSGCAASRQAGCIIVTGSIVNRAASGQRRVEVIAELLDRNMTPLDRGSSLVRSTDIGPRQSSDFRIVLDDKSSATVVRVAARTLTWDDLTPPLSQSLLHR